jgi:hypothetical protein
MSKGTAVLLHAHHHESGVFMDKDLSIFIISLLDKSKRLKKHLELDGAFFSAALLCSSVVSFCF